MKQTVKAHVLANSTLHALGLTRKEAEDDLEEEEPRGVRSLRSPERTLAEEEAGAERTGVEDICVTRYVDDARIVCTHKRFAHTPDDPETACQKNYGG